MSKKPTKNVLLEKVKKSKKKWGFSPFTLGDIKIDRELRDIIHGYIASDGYVRDDGTLIIDQSEEQEKFVQWLYKKLENLRTNNPISTVPRIDKRNNKKTYSKRFNTRALLKGFHKMWYQSSIDINGKTCYVKRLPSAQRMKGFFSSTFITVWFAGDGTKIIDSPGAKYDVTNFTVDERLQLKKLFKEKFEIEVVINSQGVSKTGTPQWALCVNAPQYDKFRSEITKIDLIPTIFPYKLHKEKP